MPLQVSDAVMPASTKLRGRGFDSGDRAISAFCRCHETRVRAEACSVNTSDRRPAPIASSEIANGIFDAGETYGCSQSNAYNAVELRSATTSG